MLVAVNLMLASPLLSVVVEVLESVPVCPAVMAHVTLTPEAGFPAEVVALTTRGALVWNCEGTIWPFPETIDKVWALSAEALSIEKANRFTRRVLAR